MKCSNSVFRIYWSKMKTIIYYINYIPTGPIHDLIQGCWGLSVLTWLCWGGTSGDQSYLKWASATPPF